MDRKSLQLKLFEVGFVSQNSGSWWALFIGFPNIKIKINFMFAYISQVLLLDSMP